MGVFRKMTNAVPIMFIRFYQRFISPLFPPACRFHPSCSTYGLKAFQTHPIHKAIWLTCWRILRCNPINPGGFDPVPPPGMSRKQMLVAMEKEEKGRQQSENDQPSSSGDR